MATQAEANAKPPWKVQDTLSITAPRIPTDKAIPKMSVPSQIIKRMRKPTITKMPGKTQEKLIAVVATFKE